ncbi:MAG TPA: hypothetical protein VK772_18770 [Puia sp.]|nr:hypothetical protein [Puia sp.]
MLEEEWKDITEQAMPAKNLKLALLAVGYAILASLAQFLALDAFVPNHSMVIRIMVGLYFILTIVSGLYAFLACRNSLKSLRTNKNTRNYIALLLGGFLLLGIARQIFYHF